MRSVFFLSAIAVLLGAGCAPVEGPVPPMTLSDGWSLIAAAEVAAEPEQIAGPGFDSDGWVATQVPTTPMAALVADGRYPDLYLGTKLEDVDTAQFEDPWWYRTEFEVSAGQAEKHAQLVFEGVNYSAEVWLNGRKLASRTEMTGAFRVWRLDVGGRLSAGTNSLAVKVFPPEAGDFTMGFVDWNPVPPDKNMGIWRPVALHFSDAISIHDVFVETDVNTESLAEATITVSTVVRNHSDEQVEATLHGTIEHISFSADAILAPRETTVVHFSADDYDALKLESPRLWWPYTLGEPNLYQLKMAAEVEGVVSDNSSVTFGIREYATYLNDEGHRGFTVNGVPVLIRGGGWVDDLLLSDTHEKIDAQVAYVKQMNLNTIRLEGFWGSSHYLYDLADREGVLIMPGWSCQWEWEDYLGKPVDEKYGGVLEPDEMDLVADSLGDQMRYLRNHPSIFTWVLASDLLPHPDLERRYETVLAEVDPKRPPLVSCAWVDSEVSGPSGVKMNGPYDWVPPVYWWSDTENGGAFGFNTETGPGPQPPPLESLKKMIPAENLWPVDEVWNYHCGRNEFNDMDNYLEALDRRYGPSASVEEFAFKAQVANYEAIRPMFEAFAAHRPLSTGVIQWMLNSAWPETYWQLYDWYLLPNGAFYGTQTACQQLNLVYNYADKAVYAVNDSRSASGKLVASLRVFDLNSDEVMSATAEVNVDAGTSKLALSLADLPVSTPVYFLDLKLADSSGHELARNFYWLSKKADVLDYDNNKWFMTPTKQFADFTALGTLAEAELDVTSSVNGQEVSVELTNPGDTLAFFVELAVTDDSGNTIVPVLWSDNYISIPPGESRKLTVRLPDGEDLSNANLRVRGWNTAVVEMPLAVK